MTSLKESAASYADQFSERFLEVLEGLQKDEDLLKEKVEKKRARFLADGVSENEIAKRLTKSYIEGAVLRSTTSGAASALPISIPIVGTIPSFLIVVSANTLYTFKNELELCYLIAYSNNTALDSDALKHRAFWLVGLSNYDEIKKRAKALGVKITLKKLVEKLAMLSVSRGLSMFFHHGLGLANFT
ncbi:MAG: hypothetical protein HYZ71_12525 [Deltaproteobacteria bacterium]|nr:hypothetical protein [Deltaproteobacteria bacterium]